MTTVFADRADAGRRLAVALEDLRGKDVVVLGLPRGGVPIAAEVARRLGAPLDVLVVRKLGVPYRPELAMGAIGEGGVRVVNRQTVDLAGVSPAGFARVESAEQAELERRLARLRQVRQRVALQGKTAIIIDDGIATGATAAAACSVARALGARRVVVAAPVASPAAVAALAGAADDVVVLEAPAAFSSVGQWYRDFSATTDDEVLAILAAAAGGYDTAMGASVDTDVEIAVDDVSLSGHLTVPRDATGIVVFAHGSGSSRHSSRNQFVARVLNGTGLATLLFDLLTPAEERDRANVFDIPLLGSRLHAVSRWLGDQPATAALPLGYFGASTGGGAALWAAAEPGSEVRAVVSRGGRPDLAGARLAAVTAPTLLIVGGRDEAVLELNRDAARQLRCVRQIEVVPGATHLFEEPGALQAVAELARDWFREHLGEAQMTSDAGTTLTTCARCGRTNRVPVASAGTPRCAACHQNLPWLVSANDDSFAAATHTRLPVLVDLWADWCGPCRMVAPGVEQAARDLAGSLKVVKVDVDAAPSVARSLNAQSIPTLLLLRDGRVVSRQVGALPADRLVAWLRREIAGHAA